MQKEAPLVPHLTGSASPAAPLLLRVMAQFFSYLFHPLFVPLYITWFLLYVHPQYFAGYDAAGKNWLIARVAYTMVFLPLMTVFLLRRLGFISSFFLHSSRDRIIPYIACGIFFFWIYLVFRNQPAVPLILTAFCFGVFLAVSAALICNIYFKISMHAIGMGGALGLMFLLLFQGRVFMGLPLVVTLLLTGCVCTSRLLVSDHRPFEIYAGIFLGLSSQILAALICL